MYKNTIYLYVYLSAHYLSNEIQKYYTENKVGHILKYRINVSEWKDIQLEKHMQSTIKPFTRTTHDKTGTKYDMIV